MKNRLTKQEKKELRDRIKRLHLTQRKLALRFRRKPQQIYSALEGEQPGLLAKILKVLDSLESPVNS